MTRVIIATAEPVLAKGLETILVNGGFHIEDVCLDVAHLFESIQQKQADIAILDLAPVFRTSMVIELKTLAPCCQLLLWPRGVSPQDASEALRLGVVGIIPLEVTPQHLIEALDLIASFPAGQPPASSIVETLCDPLERQFVTLAGHGLENGEIAMMMRTDSRQVDQLARKAARRLGAKGRHELALYGLLSAKEESSRTNKQE
jgi:DNA-binding NarL/FixJ family response regulator